MLFWYYILFLIVGSLLWLVLLLGVLKCGWFECDEVCGVLYLLGWVVMLFLFFSIVKGKLLIYILLCFVLLLILMVCYVLEVVKIGVKVLCINGMINLGVGLLGFIVVLVVLLWGFMYKLVWIKIELYKCLLVVIVFVVWVLMGWLVMKDFGCCWSFVVFCLFGLVLLVGFVILDWVIDSK